MTIIDVMDTLNAERVFGRTPSGRSIDDFGIKSIDAAVSDTKNHNAEVFQCSNCKYINSSLLFPEGCTACNSKDWETKIDAKYIIRRKP